VYISGSLDEDFTGAVQYPHCSAILESRGELLYWAVLYICRARSPGKIGRMNVEILHTTPSGTTAIRVGCRLLYPPAGQMSVLNGVCFIFWCIGCHYFTGPPHSSLSTDEVDTFGNILYEPEGFFFSQRLSLRALGPRWSSLWLADSGTDSLSTLRVRQWDLLLALASQLTGSAA
jgi:hypothetical protein